MRRPALGILGAVVAPVLLAAQVSSTDDHRPMGIVDLIDVPGLSEVQISPDGTELLYVLAEADWKENRRLRHIWRVERESGESVQLTRSEGSESSPRWSPDGETIAFLAERGEDEERQIYLLPARGGEAKRLGEHVTAVSAIEWAPDGSRLYFLAQDPKSDEQKAREKVKDDVFAFDEEYRHRHLWSVQVEDGSETRITEGDFSVRSYSLARDGEKIVLHRAPTPLIDDSDESEVWLIERDGSDARRLTNNQVAEGGGRLSPDGTQVLFLSGSNDRFESYYNRNLFVVPAAGGAHRLLLEEMPHEVTSARWSKDGRAIFFVANTGVRTALFRAEMASGEFKQLTAGDHALRGWRYDPELDLHAFTLSHATSPGDIWVFDGQGDPIQVSRVFDYLAETFLLPRQEAISWKGRDGAKVEGLLYYPVGYQAGKRYPLVVQTHGGPAASDKFGFGRWSSYVQVLTARGWLVLKPNYRGSTGYGDEVLRDMVGHYFNQSHLDVMSGVDALIERGLADGDRMVKMGWSAGGHMTNKIITFTDRFKAASSGAGAVNWISMYAQSDTRIYRTPWFGGTPWEDGAPIDTYWRHSPLSDIAKVKTPTLVLVGQNDVRVPPQQSVALYRALKSNGVETRLYMAPREPHGWRELRHALFKVNVELDWFERHALGRTYEWEKAPGDDEEETQENEAQGEAAPTGGGALEP